jgi:hypothetical protein
MEAQSHVANDHANDFGVHMTAFSDCDDLGRRIDAAYIALAVGMHVAHVDEGNGVG